MSFFVQYTHALNSTIRAISECQSQHIIHIKTPYRRCSRVNDQACIMIWDLTSLISDSSFLSQIVRDSHASLLVYKASNSITFEYLSAFYDSLQSELSTSPSSANSKSKKKPMFMMANKVDLPATDRVVAKSEGQDFATRIGAK